MASVSNFFPVLSGGAWTHALVICNYRRIDSALCVVPQNLEFVERFFRTEVGCEGTPAIGMGRYDFIPVFDLVNRTAIGGTSYRVRAFIQCDDALEHGNAELRVGIDPSLNHVGRGFRPGDALPHVVAEMLFVGVELLL